MKILIYTEFSHIMRNSGLGKARDKQAAALTQNGVKYTFKPREAFDIAHINFYGPRSFALAKAAIKAGKKVVYHAHSTEEDFKDGFFFGKSLSPLFKKWLVRCYSLGSVLVTPTEYSKRLLRKYGLTQPIFAISNGTDTGFFVKDAEAGKAYRESLGLSSDEKLIVSIGLYIERKGIVDFVELARRMPGYTFLWLGYSPLIAATRPVRKAIEEAHTLPNLILPGHVDKTIVKAALSAADLFLYPTKEETEGIPILEAFACETPTLVRDIPVFEEYPDGMVTHKAGNLEEFEGKIRDILRGALPDITKEARRVAESKDSHLVGEQLAEIYKQLSS